MSQEVNLEVLILAGLLLKSKAMFLKFTAPKYNSFFLVHICFFKNDFTDHYIIYPDVNVTENHNQTS